MSSYGSYPNPQLCSKHGKYKKPQNLLQRIFNIKAYYCKVCPFENLCHVNKKSK